MTNKTNVVLKAIESYQSKGENTQAKIEKTYTDELIIGICTPIGSKSKPIIDTLSHCLKETYNYDDIIIIKISNFIKDFYEKELEEAVNRTKAYSELIHKIEGGDHLRKEYKSNSLLIELAIKRIREDRRAIEPEDIKGRRICYIIDSLKNIDELRLLRAVYRDIFYLFSIFSPENERIKTLVDKGLALNEAEEIINKDDYEDFEHGQNVRETFVEGDFFVRSSDSNRNNIVNNIERYLHLIFNSEIVSPTYQETAMYYAKSASGNSSCLSRQVGATITDSNGMPLVQGWNDVPKCNGNLYNDSDQNPKRCKELGYCMNVHHKDNVFDEIIDNVERVLDSKQETDGQLRLVSKENSLAKSIEMIIRKSRFKNVIEYSRSIHAEMHAIIIGSQLTGGRMVGGDLYCTTYPCHNCARHIVLAGIKNIYYIEPYKKSLCLILHEDSLTEDENETQKVRILLFDGVAPRRYLDFFSMGNDDRKDNNGNVKQKDLSTISPKKRLSLQGIPVLENQAVHSLEECGILGND